MLKTDRVWGRTEIAPFEGRSEYGHVLVDADEERYVYGEDILVEG